MKGVLTDLIKKMIIIYRLNLFCEILTDIYSIFENVKFYFTIAIRIRFWICCYQITCGHKLILVENCMKKTKSIYM